MLDSTRMIPDAVAANGDTPIPVLVVEPDAKLRRSLQRELQGAGYLVNSARAAADALAAAEEEIASGLIVLDTTLPDLSGFEVLRRVRQVSNVPVVLISSRDTPIDKSYGLDLGADDYVVIPFDMAELLARVRAVLRRARHGEEHGDLTEIPFGACVMDRSRRQVLRAGAPVPLRPRAYDLLEFMATRPGRVLSRQEIIDGVWGGAPEGQGRTLDVHLRWLRQAIEPDPSHPIHVITVPRAGYRFELERPTGSPDLP